MSLTLVVGRPNAGKTGTLYAVVRRSAAAGALPVVLLPSRPDVQAVAKEFAERGPSLGVTTAIFDDYIDDLWALYGDERRIVGRTERAVLLAHAARGASLKALAGSARGNGLSKLLSPLAANMFRDVGVPSEGCGAAREIAEILATYAQVLDRTGRVERASAAQQLMDSAEHAWFAGPLVVNRFADLTPLQERFLVGAANHAEIWLSLPWEEGFAATRALDPLVARLVECGASVVWQPPGEYTRSAELRYVESNLFTAPSEAIGAPLDGDIRLSCAHGEEAEAERITAEVQTALDQGVPPDQIAVVYQNVADHIAALRSSFRAAGVVGEFDVVGHAQGTGWGRALLHLMRFAADGGCSDLLGFLRGPYSGETRQRAEETEATWRRERIERPDRLRASLWQNCPAAADLVDAAFRLAGNGRPPGTAMEWQNLVDRLLRNAYGETARVLDEDGILDVAAHRGFVRLVDETWDLMAFAVAPRDLIEAFQNLEVATLPTGATGAVRVMSASRARAQRFRVVIVGGLSAGDFPRPEGESPLTAREVVAGLASCGIDVQRKDERDMARLTFYLVASRATERLVLSRQVAASDGSELRASWLVEELLDLYRDPSDEDVDEDALPPTATLTFDDHGSSACAPMSPRRALRTAVLMGSSGADESSSARLALAARRARAREARLTNERVLQELCDRRVYSATEIETYLRCPYLWFHERVVSARALEPETGVVEVGRVCHDVLRRVFEQVQDVFAEGRVTASNLPRAVEIADRVLSEAAASREGHTFADQVALSTSVRRKVRGFLGADATFLPGFLPLAHEFEFGADPGLFEGFGLQGRVDRIDRGPDGALVVTDYKTGRVGSDHSARKFADTGLLQLALYARIVEARLGAPVIGGLYRRVSSRNGASSLNRGFFVAEDATGPGLVSTDLMSRDEVREVVLDAEERALEAVTGMRAGRIVAEPRDADACLRCGIRGLCGGARP